MTELDLTIPEIAYLFGFLQADGHLSKGSRSRGRLSVEIKASDVDLLAKFKELIPVYSSISYRRRDTNFKKKYTSVIWSLCDRDVRDTLEVLGLPYGKKSSLVEPPQAPYSEMDYFRGFIDGDGSLGLTGAGFPFLSVCTKSHRWVSAYLDLIFRLTGKAKKLNPNARDRIYTPCVYKEDAQAVVRELYYPGCIALTRKFDSSVRVLSWIRPKGMTKVTWERRRWSPKEDKVILNHSIQESTRILNRTKTSVRVRLSRLVHANIQVP